MPRRAVADKQARVMARRLLVAIAFSCLGFALFVVTFSRQLTTTPPVISPIRVSVVSNDASATQDDGAEHQVVDDTLEISRRELLDRLLKLGLLNNGSHVEYASDSSMDMTVNGSQVHPESGSSGLAEGEHPPDDLLLPEYVAQMEETKAAYDSKFVRSVWIGDIEKMPERVVSYHTFGYNFTLFTSADAILDGFAPHVRRGYELAIPFVAGIDFLKFLMLYKYGGISVDGDTFPVVQPSEVTYPVGCDVIFGKENYLKPEQFEKPIYRAVGTNTYLYSRPYQLLNWAMVAPEPRNRHVGELIKGSLRHFFGLRDMQRDYVQDVAGSGLMSDYVALLYAERGLDYVKAYKNRTVHPVEGICMMDGVLSGDWIGHRGIGTWKGE